jgi:hypothetical protein
MAAYVKQLSRPVEADPTRHSVLEEVGSDHSVCAVLLGSNPEVQYKRSHPIQFDSLKAWSGSEKNQSPLSSADDESQSSEETIEQTDQRSPGEIVLYPKQTGEEALPHTVEPTQGARESSSKRTALRDITKDERQKRVMRGGV